MVTEFECTDERRGVTGVLVGNCASLSHLGFEQEVGVTVGTAGTHSLGVVSEVYCTVFDLLEFIGFVVLFEEHTGLPAGPARKVGAT